MRENKYERLLNVSIAVLIVSALMLAFTAYNVFYKDKPAILSAKTSGDSLDVLYKQTIAAIDPVLIKAAYADNDNRSRLVEMNALRTEIDSLLLNRGSEKDLASAKVKIEELQLKVKSLQERYVDVAGQNKELRALLERLIAAQKTKSEPAFSNEPVSSTNLSNNSSAGYLKSNTAVSGVRAGSMKLTFPAGEEEETFNIQGSFTLDNKDAKYPEDIIIVILQPDGKTLRSSPWESGTFASKDGKKLYSRKLASDPAERGKLYKFTLPATELLTGVYTMQVWYQGNMVGVVRTAV